MSIFNVAVLVLGLAGPGETKGQPIAVRYAEGVVNGFLTLRSMTGELLAEGALLQTARGQEVTSRLVFYFHDGSLHDETGVYSQRGSFRLLRSHLVQKGPSFPTSLDATFDVARGTVSVRYKKGNEPEEVKTERMALPPDLANGLLFTLLKNVKPDTPKLEQHFLAFTPKPRVVELEITPAGQEPFQIGEATLKATHFVVHPELGGIVGVVAPLLGKEPPDQHVWILYKDVPAFVKFEGTLFSGGPTWRIELTSPRWPENR
jgi:hypothetical protein